MRFIKLSRIRCKRLSFGEILFIAIINIINKRWRQK